MCFMSYLVSFCSCVFFSPLSIAFTSLGEERANLSAFRTFVRFALVWFCLFPLPLGVWEELRFVILALPGLFSYLFLAVIVLTFLSRFTLMIDWLYFSRRQRTPMGERDARLRGRVGRGYNMCHWRRSCVCRVDSVGEVS